LFVTKDPGEYKIVDLFDFNFFLDLDLNVLCFEEILDKNELLSVFEFISVDVISSDIVFGMETFDDKVIIDYLDINVELFFISVQMWVDLNLFVSRLQIKLLIYIEHQLEVFFNHIFKEKLSMVHQVILL